MIMTKAVIKKVQADFPIEEQASVLDILSLYGSRSEEKEVERIRMAALDRSHGDKEQVTEYIYAAKQDFGKTLLEILEEESEA